MMKYLFLLFLFPLGLVAQEHAASKDAEIGLLLREVAAHTVVPVGAGGALFLKGHESKKSLLEKVGLAVSLYGLFIGPSAGQMRVQDPKAAARFTAGRIGVGLVTLALGDHYQKNGQCNSTENDFDDLCDTIGWAGSASLTFLALWDVLSATRKVQNGMNNTPRGNTPSQSWRIIPNILRVSNSKGAGATLQLRF
ncbi:MAG: hypothetical protein J0L94_10575 [Rhodothermia bacterium]|nr:hypothetical protein [Rhodothermia bacterium]